MSALALFAFTAMQTFFLDQQPHQGRWRVHISPLIKLITDHVQEVSHLIKSPPVPATISTQQILAWVASRSQRQGLITATHRAGHEQRLASPPHLVDLSHIEGLDAIFEMKGRSLVISTTAELRAAVATSAIVGEKPVARARQARRPDRRYPRCATRAPMGRSLTTTTRLRVPSSRTRAWRHHRHQQAPPQG